MNKPTQSNLRSSVTAELKKAPDVEVSAQPRKPSEETQRILLRTQIWNSMLTAGLSCRYYRLLAKHRTRWELIWKVGGVVVCLAGVALAGRYPEAWLKLLGGALVPFLFTVVGLFVTLGRVREAQRWIERWTVLYHDKIELWEQIESAWPNIEQFRPKFATLRERLTGFSSTEYDDPNEDLLRQAQKNLHAELELPPLRTEPLRTEHARTRTSETS